MTTSEQAEEIWMQTNVAARLRAMAEKMPHQIAMASPRGSHTLGIKRPYATQTFADLELNTSSIAAGLQQLGVKPGMRIVMLVKFGADFIALVFALLKIGAVVVLVDPGMGRKNLLRCLQATEPEGFIAIPFGQIVRMLFRRRFPKARINVTVGHRWGILPRPTLADLSSTPSALFEPPPTTLDSQAAIIFTTGSTGPPKGVLYTHRTFNSQVDALIQHYGIVPGGRDLSGFPLFGLFNAVMGTTTIIPDMDPTRPADVDPPRLLDAIDQWNVTQAFGSPALWTTVGRYADKHQRRVPSLTKVFSAGAPVPPHVLQSIRQMLPEDACMFTPYGATEALPIASIESRDVLNGSAERTKQGAGTCVGKNFSGIEWRVIAIDDGPLETLEQTTSLPNGQIGELMVSGDVVTTTYVTRLDQNPLHKVKDGQRVWHRMGDVGYIDDSGLFWFCGRKSHRVRTKRGDLFTEQCEAIVNQHPSIYRSALVGVGAVGEQTPVIIVEPWPEHAPTNAAAQQQLIAQMRDLCHNNPITQHIEKLLVYPERLPTDIRHNSKIFREQLTPWAAKVLATNP
jgi:olefin beta-lactone synthetase